MMEITRFIMHAVMSIVAEFFSLTKGNSTVAPVASYLCHHKQSNVVQHCMVSLLKSNLLDFWS